MPLPNEETLDARAPPPRRRSPAASLTSFRYHARRAGHEPVSSAAAHGVVTRREEDGRFAFVEIRVDLDVTLDPAGAGRDSRADRRKASATASSPPRSPSSPTITGPSTGRTCLECDTARRHRRSLSLHGAAAPARILRRPRRDAVPRRGDRRHRRLPAARQRERRCAVRDVAPHVGARRPGPREGRDRSSAARATRSPSARA